MTRHRLGRWAVVGAAAMVAALTTPAFAKAPAEHDSASPAATAQRADANGDRIADDLAATLAAGGRERFDVIVRFAGGPSHANMAEAEAAVGNLHVRYAYNEISAAAVSVTAAQVRALARRPQTVRIDADAQVEVALETARRGFGVDAAQQSHNVDGSGVTIAVLDTGIDARHADLDGGKLTAFADCLASACTEVAPYDDNGHGTHVASIIAGDGDAEPGRPHRGVAPGATLVGVKVLDSRGTGSMSGVDRAIEWVIANRGRLGIRAINLSLSTTGCADGADSTAALITQAADKGIAAFAAAGNKGPKSCTVASPAAAADAITVAAMADPDDNEGSRPPGFSLADFSSRGPTADGRLKPDLAAAGVDISAARSGTVTSYAVKSGTSMAAPFVAGAGALALQANPALDARTLKHLLTTTAVDAGPPGPDNEYGHGRLDVEALLDAATLANVGLSRIVPSRIYLTGEVTSTAPERSHVIRAGPDAPIAVTLVMPTWSGSSSPDLDVYLLDPQGRTVASSQGITRQETIGWRPPVDDDYELRVSRYAGAGPYWMEVSYDGASADAPAPPTNVVATDEASGGAIRVSWRPNTEDDLAGYRFYRDGELATVDLVPGTEHLDTGLTNGTEYYYAVTAVDEDGNESRPSATVSSRPTDGDPPAPPTGLTATVDGGLVALDWDDNAEPDLASYRVTRNGVLIGSPTASTLADPSVAEGLYTYEVAAIDTGGLIGTWNFIPVTVTRSAILITVTSTKVKNGTRVDIRWANAAGTTVRLLRNGTQLTDTANDSQHSDTLRKIGTYSYRVCEIVGGATGRCSTDSSPVVI